jgi:hypothetical protein
MAPDRHLTKGISERAMFNRPIVAVAIMVLSAGLARAQITPIASGLPEGADGYRFGLTPGYERPLTAQDMREQEIEKKYKETLKKIPDKKPSNDPWAGIRASPVADRHRPI